MQNKETKYIKYQGTKKNVIKIQKEKKKNGKADPDTENKIKDSQNNYESRRGEKEK